HHPRPTLFPYTTLFRSEEVVREQRLTAAHHAAGRAGRKPDVGSVELHALTDRRRDPQGIAVRLSQCHEGPLRLHQAHHALERIRSEEHTSELQSRSDLV